ncbi:MAG TPA: hypothetical protein VHD85_00490 [Terracidiphilus sp.]|nr:hypothetical protein [Terracidiphilus sp.]
MRGLLLLVGLLNVTFGSIQAQWQIENSTTTADLRGIDNVGGGIAWASGTNGTVLRTEDGGYLWQPCTVPPGAEHLDFRGIQAFDANTAIVMSSGKGDLSRLYKTTDGCQTWKLMFTNPDKDGFWDAVVMTDRNIGVVVGDPVLAEINAEDLAIRKSHFVFPTYHTIDGGQHWRRNDHDRLSAHVGKDAQPSEAIFAASNSSILLLPYTELFVTGGLEGGLRYSQYSFGAPPESCGFCESFDESDSMLASGETAGGFSVAANYGLSTDPSEAISRVVVIVGGDFKAPDRVVGTAANCGPQKSYALTRFVCEPAQTLPHGYRSSVAYDAATKTWITVGPNGTDISTDDGRNWRAVHPDAALHEEPDADRNWNALSLPFVVGPHGRIGKLDAQALTGHISTAPTQH